MRVKTRSPFLIPFSFVLCIGSFAGCSKPAAGPEETPPGSEAMTVPKECNPNSPCEGSTCQASITAASTTVPVDACPREGEFQSDVDVYAWNTFIALNWPADLSTCTGDTTKSILGGIGPRVWETYTLDSNLFVSSGQPAGWCDAAATATLSKPRYFGRLRKVSANFAADFPDVAEAVGGVLTDQNGRFVRYEVRVNMDEYNYVTYNDLWQASGQTGQTINFPQGPNDSPSRCGDQPCGPVGAMEIKSAWKVLSDSEIGSGRFYMTEAVVDNDEQGTPSPGKNPVTLGLVGLHIIHKTSTQSTWFWSTFEQVDNTKSSFFNPTCTTCTDNQQTASKPYTELDANGKPINSPVQVVRTNSIESNDPSAPALNAYYRGLLKGSVWENYELVSTMWTTGGAPGGTPTPLANTTLETYIQPNSSCFGCHSGAKTAVGTPADQSFLLGEAQ